MKMLKQIWGPRRPLPGNARVKEGTRSLPG